MVFARIISYLFHPALIPTLSVALILNLDTYLRYAVQPTAKYYLYGILIINTFVFPTLVLLLLKARKSIESIHLYNRQDRIIPFGVAVIFYFFTYNIMMKMSLPPILLSIFLGISFSVIMSFLLTFFIKVSVHMVGISGLLAAMLALYMKFSADYGAIIMTLALIWGIVGYARLKLNSHNPVEIYLGSLLGFISVFATAMLGITI